MNRTPSHPRVTRRKALQAGSIGLLGLGMNHLAALHEAAGAPAVPKARSAIFIFLSGGLGQHDSFDLKPEAPDNIRGEFRPIETHTPGVRICEHLPGLAARSHLWSLVRSLTHPYNDHSQGHMAMLSGRTPLPPTFNGARPMPEDWPAIAAVAGQAAAAFPDAGLRPRTGRSAEVVGPRGNLPPAVVLPERLVHASGRVLPGQFAGIMGARRDPWFIEASPPKAYSAELNSGSKTYGAYPEYAFDYGHEFDPVRARENARDLVFQAPSLTLPEGLGHGRLDRRMDLLRHVERQRRDLDRFARVEDFDRYREGAVSLLTDPRVKRVFDVTGAEPRVLDRYGRNAFGWSLLMARRLVEAGVRLVQVNLGNNETWDTHGNAFPILKEALFPPADLALSALLDDLHDRGLLASTLVVMAGEFGRTPRVFGLPRHYKLPGRDHWGAVQTVFFAGGGVTGGRVVGASDKEGAYPAADPQTPENMAATIYHALGIPPTAAWKDELERPHHVYHGEPITGL